MPHIDLLNQARRPLPREDAMANKSKFVDQHFHEAKLGPFYLKGVLTADQKTWILDNTACTVSHRERTNWGNRMYTIHGPPEKLIEARSFTQWLSPLLRIHPGGG